MVGCLWYLAKYLTYIKTVLLLYTSYHCANKYKNISQQPRTQIPIKSEILSQNFFELKLLRQNSVWISALIGLLLIYFVNQSSNLFLTQLICFPNLFLTSFLFLGIIAQAKFTVVIKMLSRAMLDISLPKDLTISHLVIILALN